MAQASSHTYKPLQEKENIRTLTLEPALNPVDPVSCTLDEVWLSCSPIAEYIAISYTWDGQLPSRPIHCNGSELLVTENCYAALLALRHSHKSVHVWVDSVCINQTDLAEKSTQVAMMAQIYQSAWKVFVWLGEWDDGLRHAVKILKSLVPPQMSDPETSAIDRHEGEGLQRQLHQNAMDFMERVRSSEDDPFAALFARTWFQRMWTVQEITLSDPTRVLIADKLDSESSIQWGLLISATDALKAKQYRYAGQIEKALKLQRLLTTLHLAEKDPGLRDILRAKGGADFITETAVAPLLRFCREKVASNPKDKIIALYSIFKELRVELPLPDYEKSVEDIYREATLTCINHDRDLRVLYDVPSDRRHENPHLASWVPDWSDPGWGSNGHMDCRVAITKNRFCPSGSSDSVWSFTAQQRHLHVSGCIIDEIIYCSEPVQSTDPNDLIDVLEKRRKPPEPSPISTILNTLSEQMSRLSPRLGTATKLTGNIARLVTELASAKPPPSAAAFRTLKSWVDFISFYADYPTGEPVSEAFCRTLRSDYSPIPPRDMKGEAWYRAMVGCDRSVLDCQTDDEVEQYINSARGNDMSYLSIASMYMRNKALFTTESGYMGTAPARNTPEGGTINLAQPRDQIALLAGLDLPVILRPVENSEGGRIFRYVAHAYVHGIMYGEAWDRVGHSFEDIVLG